MPKEELPLLDETALLVVAPEEFPINTYIDIITIVRTLKRRGMRPIYYISPEYATGNDRKRLIPFVDRYCSLKRSNIENIRKLFEDIPRTKKNILVLGTRLGACINSTLKLAKIPRSVKKIVLPSHYIGSFHGRHSDDFWNQAKRRLEEQKIDVEMLEITKFEFRQADRLDHLD